jgi:hypothetical protein
MSKMFQVYGIGQALIPVLPPPLGFENAPNSHQTNYEIGQIVFTPPLAPTAFYMYAGAGNWVEFATNSGAIISVVGTTNQVAVSTATGVATVSLPSALIAPGSIAATTTLTATLGAITATNGNLVLGTAGNKIIIPTGSNASAGTSGAMSGSPGAVTVATTASSSTALIYYSRKTTGGTPGQVSITAQDGTGFTLTSTGNETSTFNWWIINA